MSFDYDNAHVRHCARPAQRNQTFDQPLISSEQSYSISF